MVNELISNIIVITVAVGFFLSLRLPDKPKYLTYGSALTSIGAIRLLNYYGIIGLEIPKIPVITYAINILALIVGGGLIVEAIRERSIIRWSSFLLGLPIVVLSMVPTLYGLNAITFNLPSYPAVINYYLHVAAGIMLFIGVMIVDRRPAIY